jgi:4-amino-4-deoxy-L-arabinose transferase-like glycosyltransferase
LAAIIAVYLILGSLHALLTPPWQFPDEPAHFNYIRHIVTEGALPELRPGDYPAQYLEEIKARRFDPALSIASIRYESHQPPLYYLWASAIYRLSQSLGEVGALRALRLFSVLLGAVGVWVAYRVVRQLTPESPTLALGAAAFGATLPMHIAMTAAVNNDVLSELLLGLVAWTLVSASSQTWGWRGAALLGVLLGFAMLTKLQSYVALGLALLVLAWDAWRAHQAGTPCAVRAAVARAAAMLGVAFVLVLPWLWRNIGLYGWSDPLGMVRHDQVVVGQLTTRQLAAEIGWGALARQGVVTTFQSFWGQFGWMGVPLDARLYAALGLLTLLTLLGLAAWVANPREGPRSWSPEARRGLWLLAAWAALTTLAFLWYNTKYVQHQGRYLFPAIVPWGLAFALGLRGLLRMPLWQPLAVLGALLAGLLAFGLARGDLPGTTMALVAVAGVAVSIGRWLEQRWHGAASLVVVAAMAALSLYSLFVVAIPALTP